MASKTRKTSSDKQKNDLLRKSVANAKKKRAKKNITKNKKVSGRFVFT